MPLQFNHNHTKNNNNRDLPSLSGSVAGGKCQAGRGVCKSNFAPPPLPLEMAMRTELCLRCKPLANSPLAVSWKSTLDKGTGRLGNPGRANRVDAFAADVVMIAHFDRRLRGTRPSVQLQRRRVRTRTHLSAPVHQMHKYQARRRQHHWKEANDEKTEDEFGVAKCFVDFELGTLQTCVKEGG